MDEEIIEAAFAAGTRLPPTWAKADAGAQLRAVRLDRRISQRHLAQEAGVSQSFVCRLEAGRCDATLTVWRKLFEALGCWWPLPRTSWISWTTAGTSASDAATAVWPAAGTADPRGSYSPAASSDRETAVYRFI